MVTQINLVVEVVYSAVALTPETPYSAAQITKPIGIQDQYLAIRPTRPEVLIIIRVVVYSAVAQRNNRQQLRIRSPVNKRKIVVVFSVAVQTVIPVVVCSPVIMPVQPLVVDYSEILLLKRHKRQEACFRRA